MNKVKEMIDYSFFDNYEFKKIKPVNYNCKFSFYIIVNCELEVDIKTIQSILSQTFTWFELVIFNLSKKNIKIVLENNNIYDDRVVIYNVGDICEDDIIKKTNSDYLIKTEMGTYFNNSYLDIIYSNISINKNADLFITNSVNYKDNETKNDIIVNLSRRRINVFTNTYCFRKNILLDVINNNLSNKNIVHLNYYGVYEQKTINNYFSISESLINYPKSSVYYFNSEPSNLNLIPKTAKFDDSILCFMPWAKIGGADLFNLNIIKYLKTIGYKIIVITTDDCPYEARDSFELIVDAYYDLTTFLPREYWPDFIKNIIENMNVKLIFQMNSLYTYHLLPWIKSKFSKLPIIEYLHAEDFSWRNGGYPKDSTAVQSFIDKTYTCNNHLKFLMRDKMNRNIDNVQTLYIGVDTDKFNPDVVDITDVETQEFCKDKKVILFPSRFSLEKRPMFLLNVMKALNKNRSDIVCLMVGDGDVKNDMKNYIEKNNLNDCVKLIPMQKDIRQYYKLSDITVICSLSEGITLTTYESLSMNVPVISADVGGQSEVVNQNNGLIIPRFQDISKDLYNFNYSNDEIELYIKAINNILNNTNKYKGCRDSVLNNYSQKVLFETIGKEVNNLVRKQSNFNDFIDENFAIRFLVLFNEASKVYYHNSIEYNDFKEYIKNKMWSKRWWRCTVKVMKKFKVDKIVKKVYFKEK